MEQEQRDQLSDTILDEACRSEYVSNPIESYEAFKEKKKQRIHEDVDKLIDNVFRGILLFVLMDKDNKRIFNLLEKFVNLDQNSAFDTTDVQTISKNIVEHNIFGLEESDFDRMIAMADKVCEDKHVDEAIDMYLALTVLFPLRIESWLRWGNAEYQHQFDYNKVLNIYKSCAKVSDHPAIYFSMGICHVKGDQLELAKECFEKSLELCDIYDEKELKENVVDLMKDITTLAV